jgi:hypothetical protein
MEGLAVAEQSTEVARRQRQAAETALLNELEQHEAPQPESTVGLMALQKSRLDQAQRIANDRDTYGTVLAETREYIDSQNRTYLQESIGKPFRNSFEQEFDPTLGDFLDQAGKPRAETIKQAALGARLLQTLNPDFGFYAKRTISEQANYHDLVHMMQHDPVGTTIGLVSPAEYGPHLKHLSRDIGMFPDRKMAIVQLVRKVSPTAAYSVFVSLDNATLAQLGILLREEGVEVPANLKAENYLEYQIRLHSPSNEALDRHIDAMVKRFDDRIFDEVHDQVHQGQVTHQKLDTDTLFKTELKVVQAEQYTFDEALSYALMNEPQPLHPLLRADAQAALARRRSDNGAPMLNEKEQQRLHALLAADKIDIKIPTHALALLTLKSIHETGVTEIVHKYLKGDHDVLGFLPRTLTASPRETIQGGIHLITFEQPQEYMLRSSSDFIGIAGTAAEEGRLAAACGSRALFGQKPEASSSLIERLMEGESVEDILSAHASLEMKYGAQDVEYGTCRLCEKEGFVAKCGFCNTCDTRDRLQPGYIDRALKGKEILQGKNKRGETVTLKLAPFSVTQFFSLN